MNLPKLRADFLAMWPQRKPKRWRYLWEEEAKNKDTFVHHAIYTRIRRVEEIHKVKLFGEITTLMECRDALAISVFSIKLMLRPERFRDRCRRAWRWLGK